MAVNLSPPENLLPVAGVRLATACAEIKQSERDDIAVVTFAPGTTVAGVYTQSAFRAAPVDIAQARQADALAWVINSGNANAATGEPGREDALAVCDEVSDLLGLDVNAVQPFSTGVIGERLPVPQMRAALAQAVQRATEHGWDQAAQAIMTTDTVPKARSVTVDIDGQTVTLTGMAKGSGMIKPDMATMLAYIATDANIAQPLLHTLVREVADASFNRITVDGDTSTNDCFMLAATGAVAMDEIAAADDPRLPALRAALTDLAIWLAQAIVRDGEGATKFVTVRVEGGGTPGECLDVAYTVAESPLVKTALFAGDANWGRFCMAIGRAGVPNLDQTKVALWLDEVQVAAEGLMCDSYEEDAGASVLAGDEFTVRIDLGRGSCVETIWTTDLSYEYVRINAEYRT